MLKYDPDLISTDSVQNILDKKIIHTILCTNVDS